MRATWILIILSLTLAGSMSDAQSGISTNQTAQLYAGPGHTYTQIAVLAAGTPLKVKARNEIGNWLWVLTADHQRGWLPIGYLQLTSDFQLDKIRISRALPHADLSRVRGELSASLYSAPILPKIESHLCSIYHRGIEGGNKPNGVTKIGDSNSASPRYLGAIGRGDYDLGPYAFLQPAVDYFGASLANGSVAARVGMNATSVFDPFWSTSERCSAGESPLACEYRISRPSIAVIMFGINDTKVLSGDGYATQLQRVIEETLIHNIIPLVVSFSAPADLDNYSQVVRFNLIAKELAAEYDIPFVNFWAAAQGLPRGGVGDDHIHLTQSGGRFVLGSYETFYGLTLHNLLILHVLQQIYETCIAVEVNR